MEDRPIKTYLIKLNDNHIEVPIKFDDGNDSEIYYFINKYINTNNITYFKSQAKKNAHMAYILGIYYQKNNNYNKLKKYYLHAIKIGNCDRSMNNLGYHYEIQNDYNNMKKYYLLAIKNNYSISAVNLAHFYGLQKDYKNMIKYYLIGVKNNNVLSMNRLALYYKVQKDYNKMKKYYLMGIKNNDLCSMNNLTEYYGLQEDYNKMIKYYKMTKGKGSKQVLEHILRYYMELENDNYVIHYGLIAINNGYFYIVVHLFDYLVTAKEKIDILDIYGICCDSKLYSEYELYKFRNILNINKIKIKKYLEKRHIIRNNIMNIHTKCNDITTLVINYLV
jgi:hypothetical protein